VFFPPFFVVFVSFVLGRLAAHRRVVDSTRTRRVTVLSEKAVRDEIVKYGARLYDRGYVLANGGNISVRLNPNEALITPTGECLGDLTTDMLVKVNLRGKKLEGYMNPSSETKSHVLIYRLRPEVNAVIHAHPPYLTGMAIAGETFEQFAHPETYVIVGRVGGVPYRPPHQMASQIGKALKGYNALMWANHGVLTVGATLRLAHFRMESLEMLAHSVTVAKIHGRVNPLTPSDLKRLDGFVRLVERRSRGA